MASIQVNIDVNDDEFKNLCINNINDLPKDKMEELLLKAVEVALIRDKEIPYYDTNRSILVKRSSQSDYKYEPTELMQEIIKEINAKGHLDSLAEEVATYIRDNYKTIVQECVVKAFTQMLFTQAREYDIKNQIFTEFQNRR